MSQSESIFVTFDSIFVSLSTSCYFHIMIFASKKANIVKDLLDKKASATGKLATSQSITDISASSISVISTW